jgi:hypothetical protein
VCQELLGWIGWPKSRFNKRSDPRYPPVAAAGDPTIAKHSVDPKIAKTATINANSRSRILHTVALEKGFRGINP